MKKILSAFLTFAFILLPISINEAQGKSETTIFESSTNLSKLDSYNVKQAFYGDFKIKDGEEDVSGKYKINFSSLVNNKKDHKSDSYSRISASINLKHNADNESKMFDTASINVGGEAIFIFEKGLYLRLSKLNINVTGISDGFGKMIIEGAKEEAKEYKNKWFYLPMSIIEDELESELGEGLGKNLMNSKEIEKRMQEEGMKEFIVTLISQMAENEGATDKEVKQVKEVINRVFETKLFTEKNVKRGRNKGLKAFRINKGEIISLLKEISKIIDEEISSSDMKEISNFLRKLNLSGVYRINKNHGIMDAFLLRISIRNIEELERFRLNYRQNITGINKGAVIREPKEAVNIGEMIEEAEERAAEDLKRVEKRMAETEALTNAYQTPKVEVNIEGSPMKGDENAPITMVEFSDYECPFCSKFTQGVFKEIEKEYINKGSVKYVFRDFPLPFHHRAKPAAIAARCAREQKGDEMYFKYHDKIFENQSALKDEDLIKYAKELKLNESKFKTCLSSGKFNDEIEKDMKEAQGYGVRGTPAFFINGRMISGAQPFESFKAIIESELSSNKTSGGASSFWNNPQGGTPELRIAE